MATAHQLLVVILSELAFSSEIVCHAKFRFGVQVHIDILIMMNLAKVWKATSSEELIKYMLDVWHSEIS